MENKIKNNVIEDLSIRQNGKSTRLIDNYVQTIFNNLDVWITIKCEYHNKNMFDNLKLWKLDYYIFEAICNRLSSEHKRIKYEIKNSGDEFKIRIVQENKTELEK